MIEKDKWIEALVENGISISIAICVVEISMKLMDGPKVTEARRAINKRYYDARAGELKAKARERKESLRRLKNPVSDGFQTVQTTETGKYLAKIGTKEHDAWNVYLHDTTGKGLPHSDKVNGWYVPSPMPPSRIGAAA